jgi:hypothetical protein
MATLKKNDQLVKLLKELEPGFLPYDIFVEIARLVVLPIIEFVPLRMNKEGDVEVLLLSRGKDDPLWPDMLHTPGTVIRPTDREGEMYLAFERITKDELNATLVSRPYYVGSVFHGSKRGMEQSQVFWVEVLEEPKIGKFYSANKLPVQLIDSQQRFIEQAVKNFKEFKQHDH